MDFSRKRDTAAGLALVLALGVGLRWYHLGARSIWFDEAFTWRTIQFPFGEMLMLYYLGDRGHCYLYEEEGATPHYLGAAVLRREDLIGARGLRELASPRFWFVDATLHLGGVRQMPGASLQEAEEERRFREVFGLQEIIVRRYGAPHGDPPSQAGRRPSTAILSEARP